jgi:hypothetical protein
MPGLSSVSAGSKLAHMRMPTEGRDAAVEGPSAGRFVLLCFALAAAWLGFALLLRALGWLPGSLGEEPYFGTMLAIGMPVMGVILGVFRTRSLRGRSTS